MYRYVILFHDTDIHRFSIQFQDSRCTFTFHEHKLQLQFVQCRDVHEYNFQEFIANLFISLQQLSTILYSNHVISQKIFAWHYPDIIC